jgi:hypothetical protein
MVKTSLSMPTVSHVLSKGLVSEKSKNQVYIYSILKNNNDDTNYFYYTEVYKDWFELK